MSVTCAGSATLTGVGFLDFRTARDRTERDRAPPGLEVLGGELFALAIQSCCFAWKAALLREAPAFRAEQQVS